MFKDKRGLSTVVTTLIIILLVLIAIGIIWVVIGGVIQKGAKKTEILNRCNLIDVQATDGSFCSSSIIVAGKTDCVLKIERKPGADSDPIDGIKVVFKDATQSSVVLDSDASSNFSGIGTQTFGDINVLEIKTLNSSGYLAFNPTKVETTVYLKDQGEKKPCPITKVYTF